MEKTINRNLLQYAAGHHITCKGCKAVLDCRTTVHATLSTPAGHSQITDQDVAAEIRTWVICGTCYDANRAELYKAALILGVPLEVIDGRDLWPPTLAQAKRICKALGVTLRFNRDTDEYDCNLAGGREATRYYTSDLNDAIGTARMMAKHKGGK